MPSAKFSINKDQWKSIGKSLWKYTAPLVLVFLLSIQAGTPLNEALYVLYGAALQVIINFVSKFVTETK